MKCNKCGSLLPEDSLFCSRCGEEVKKEQVPEYVPLPLLQKLQTPRRNGGRAAALVVSMLALVLIAVGLSIWVMTEYVSAGKRPAKMDQPGYAVQQMLCLEIYNYSGECIGKSAGFLVNDAVTLVTDHRVADMAHHVVAVTADGQRSVDVNHVLLRDVRLGIAVLQCSEDIGITPLVLGDSDKVKEGDMLFGAGCDSTAEEGSVFSVDTDDGVQLLQVTTELAQEETGGVLIDRDGRVVGFVPAGAQSEQGWDLAVSSNDIGKLLRQGARKQRLELLYARSHPQIQYVQHGQYCVVIESFLFPSWELAEQVYEVWLNGSGTRAALVKLIKEYGAEQRAPREDYLLPGMWEEEFDQWAFDINRSIGDTILYESEDGVKLCIFCDADSQYAISVQHISEYTDQLEK